MDNNKSYFSYLSIAAAIFTVIGLLLGKYLYQDGPLVSFSSNNGKVEEVISQVLERYVDTVNQSQVTDYTITALLGHLDPHSTYIPSEMVYQVREKMRGNFVGIGIEYRIIDDSLVVVLPIEGGPSKKAGILAGDRLIGLNGNEFNLGEISVDSLSKLLRGKAGSKLKVLIYRPFGKKKLLVQLTRKEIPIYSIEAAFLLNDSIGFVHINRFAQKTFLEFKEATEKLIRKGAKNLIIDVRGNPGGLLKSVESLCNEFLNTGDTILSTRRQNKIDYKIADGSGMLKNIPLTIIVDRNSASASEILAGTLQDHDRAAIVGRRTFGKGLVQAVITLKDKSRINLTIAKYYLPSGRSIQKPYLENELIKYKMERYMRIESGELYNKKQMSLHDSLKFYTKKGRIVYSESGVTPDVLIPIDTVYFSRFQIKLREKGILRDFAVKFYTPQQLEGDTPEECFQNINDTELIKKLINYSITRDIKWNNENWIISKAYLLNKVKAYIIRLKFGNNGYKKMSSSMDKDILTAIDNN